MSTFQEAIFHTRSGGTARLGDKIIRFLTREEAEPILRATRPDRIVVDGIVKKIAPPNYDLKRLGLYDVGPNLPVEFRPTEEDIASKKWMREGEEEIADEVEPPETVEASIDALPDVPE